jgi:hypothetical protein
MTTISPARGQDHEVTLSRDLRPFDIAMIGVGAMIGAGIFVLTGVAAGKAGPGLLLAFLLNGIVTTFTAMASHRSIDLAVTMARQGPGDQHSQGVPFYVLSPTAPESATTCVNKLMDRFMVKRRSGRMHSFLRQTVLEPTTGASVKRDNGNRRRAVSATDSPQS